LRQRERESPGAWRSEQVDPRRRTAWTSWLGVKPDELKEIVYLTTVTAGFPRAIEAAQALREVFSAQPANAISR
jgi:hypothetical protein